MNEYLNLAVSLLVGALLGVIFFGGLWWTVNKSITSKYSALWFVASWLLRMGVVLGGFYFVSRDQWQRLVISLLGFVVARWIVMRLTRRVGALQTSVTAGPTRAP